MIEKYIINNVLIFSFQFTREFHKEFPITKSKWNFKTTLKIVSNHVPEASNNRYNFYLKFVL